MVRDHQQGMVRFLLKHGEKEANGDLAVRGEHGDIFGYPLRARGERGDLGSMRSALHEVVLSRKGYFVNTLLGNGASADARDSIGDPPLPDCCANSPKAN